MSIEKRCNTMCERDCVNCKTLRHCVRERDCVNCKTLQHCVRERMCQLKNVATLCEREIVSIDRFPNYCLVRVTGHDRSLRAARSLLFHTFLMDESRSDSEKMDKKEKSDDYDSPSDLWSVF